MRLWGVLRRELRTLRSSLRGPRERVRRLGPVLAVDIREGEAFCAVRGRVQDVLRTLRGPLPSIVEVCGGTVLNMVSRNVGVGDLSVLPEPVLAPNRFGAGGDEESTAHHRKYGVQEKHGEGVEARNLRGPMYKDPAA